MYTTYHLNSAQELSTDILEAIKVAFKSKPITIIVEEDEDDFPHYYGLVRRSVWLLLPMEWIE